MWKRSLIVLAAGATLPASIAVPASADVPSPTELPAKTFYGFEVVIEAVFSTRRTTPPTVDADGNVVTHTTGELVQRITNKQGKKSITVDVSGGETDIVSTDGTRDRFVADGNNLLIFGPNGRRNTGEPAVVLTSGPVEVTATIDPTRKVRTARTSHLNGTQVDVCQALAR